MLKEIKNAIVAFVKSFTHKKEKVAKVETKMPELASDIEAVQNATQLAITGEIEDSNSEVEVSVSYWENLGVTVFASIDRKVEKVNRKVEFSIKDFKGINSVDVLDISTTADGFESGVNLTRVVDAKSKVMSITNRKVLGNSTLKERDMRFFADNYQVQTNSTEFSNNKLSYYSETSVLKTEYSYITSQYEEEKTKNKYHLHTSKEAFWFDSTGGENKSLETTDIVSTNNKSEENYEWYSITEYDGLINKKSETRNVTKTKNKTTEMVISSEIANKNQTYSQKDEVFYREETGSKLKEYKQNDTYFSDGNGKISSSNEVTDKLITKTQESINYSNSVKIEDDGTVIVLFESKIYKRTSAKETISNRYEKSIEDKNSLVQYSNTYDATFRRNTSVENWFNTEYFWNEDFDRIVNKEVEKKMNFAKDTSDLTIHTSISQSDFESTYSYSIDCAMSVFVSNGVISSSISIDNKFTGNNKEAFDKYLEDIKYITTTSSDTYLK